MQELDLKSNKSEIQEQTIDCRIDEGMACLKNLEQREGLFYQCQGLRSLSRLGELMRISELKINFKKINLRR
ncbi:hypothetical protein [Campylobacter lanienae]|uniref:hypothetical protein n=1 Tax=Campylobacter lanienae TaxID=75658 RepID=UPI00112FB7CD|nr:hypothetical protein [Campylobacter lanienae]